MASFLLLECLENIFLNLLDENPSGNTRTYTSTNDLYSCTLVSRHWCRISTPLLYVYPFHHFRHLAYPNICFDISNTNENHLFYFKLIRTLLCCIPKSEIEQIILSNSSGTQKIFTLFCSDSQNTLATFNYVSFIRGLIFDEILSNPHELFRYKKLWLPPYILNNNSITENQFSTISIPIINHLVKFLCKNCNNLTTLEFPLRIQNNEFFNNTIELLKFKDRNEKSKLNNLKELYCMSRYDNLQDLYFALSNSVCNLSLLYNDGINSVEEAISLSQFITLQKKLKHIILSENIYDSIFHRIDHDYNIVFNSLSTQSENLQILEFKNLSFTGINENSLNSLCLLKNIRELKLYKCKGINDHLNSWARVLTKLKIFEFVTYYYTSISESFLTQLIQSSSNTLIKFVINYEIIGNQPVQLFQQISLYLKSLTHLDLSRIYPNELISIFKSCTRLVYLSIVLSDSRTWEENFKILGKFIPKNLQKIRFRGIIFSSKALKCFFEDCVYNDSKLRYLEINRKRHINQKYFDVAKQFGIRLEYTVD